jgi:hypothetical protein
MKGNWKTSAAGVVGALLAILGDFEKILGGHQDIGEMTTGAGMIALAVGLFFAKDSKKKEAVAPKVV